MRAGRELSPSSRPAGQSVVVRSSSCTARTPGVARAVVAADSPGLRDSVRRDETGLLVPFDDDAALAAALLRVLDDAQLRERLARAGIEWAARFTWPACARDSLDALLAARGGGA